MTTWAYYRVSTDKQDFNTQKFGVVDYCRRNNLTIDKEVIDDGVSGAVKAKERKLWRIIKEVQHGDFLIVSELSRLGRSTTDVLNTCGLLAKKNVNVYFVKQAMGLDQSPMGKMILAILSAFSEMERDLIRLRTIEGIERARLAGKKLGRPFGFTWNKLKEDEVRYLRGIGKNKCEIARILNCSRNTVARFMEKFSID